MKMIYLAAQKNKAAFLYTLFATAVLLIVLWTLTLWYYTKDKSDTEHIGKGPSEEYEILRHRVYSNTKELLYYLSREVESPSQENVTNDKKHVFEQAIDRTFTLLADQQRMWAVDGYAEWRKREASKLSALVQSRLRALQNPPDCQAARKVVCKLKNNCGFGCQIHHLVYCLQYAYATNRTLILKSRGWRNYNVSGWEEVFLPLSDTCTTDIFNVTNSSSQDTSIVLLPIILELKTVPAFLSAIPSDLAKRMVRFNGDPAAWWIGQLVHYIFRLQPSVAAEINRTATALYKPHTVGIHVRRSDKIQVEAKYKHINEYMKSVYEYWRLKALVTGSNIPRRVYIASDDPTVIEEARKNYPEVEFIGNAERARKAATLKDRHTSDALHGMLIDLTMLASSEYLVCTFSSNVGRLTYELMQANRPDASESISSLDDVYFFVWRNLPEQAVVVPHSPKTAKDIELKEGDIIAVMPWNSPRDGVGKGTNLRTKKTGQWPWYKTTKRLVLFQVPANVTNSGVLRDYCLGNLPRQH